MAAVANIDYDLMDKNGGLIHSYTSTPCFSSLKGMSAAQRREIDAVVFFPKLWYREESDKNGYKNDCISYFGDLQEIGFPIFQTPESILEKGFVLPLRVIQKSEAVVSGAEILGTLSAIRYVEESPSVVNTYLDLRDEYGRSISKWDLFQLAHKGDLVGGKRRMPYRYGDGHSVLSHSLFGSAWLHPWEDVQKYIRNTAEQHNFYGASFNSWGVNNSYGLAEGDEPGNPRYAQLQRATLNLENFRQLKEAMTPRSTLWNWPKGKGEVSDQAENFRGEPRVLPAPVC
jgi:hypothetical protein